MIASLSRAAVGRRLAYAQIVKHRFRRPSSATLGQVAGAAGRHHLGKHERAGGRDDAGVVTMWRKGLALGALVTLLVLPSFGHGATLSGEVTRVVDGDTVKVRSRGFETTVRLIGIDTPETRDPSRPVGCFGPEASAQAKRLLPAGRRVRLVTDDTQDTRDRYGRLLAYVYTPGSSGPTGSVNHRLVRGGYAKVYVYGGVRFVHAGAFFRAQHRARAAKLGLWGPPCFGDADREAAAPSGRGCDPNYAGACVPLSSSDLDCADVGRPVRVVGSDRHRLDGDGDGRGCERS
jgi:micrococcal nuclease